MVKIFNVFFFSKKDQCYNFELLDQPLNDIAIAIDGLELSFRGAETRKFLKDLLKHSGSLL